MVIPPTVHAESHPGGPRGCGVCAPRPAGQAVILLIRPSHARVVRADHACLQSAAHVRPLPHLLWHQPFPGMCSPSPASKYCPKAWRPSCLWQMHQDSCLPAVRCLSEPPCAPCSRPPLARQDLTSLGAWCMARLRPSMCRPLEPAALMTITSFRRSLADPLAGSPQDGSVHQWRLPGGGRGFELVVSLLVSCCVKKRVWLTSAMRRLADL